MSKDDYSFLLTLIMVCDICLFFRGGGSCIINSSGAVLVHKVS